MTCAQANAAPKAWCAEVNAAVHSEICAVPDERLVVERELLRPLPSLRLRDRGGVGAPQGRPAVVCPVRLGPLLGAHPADRHHAWTVVVDHGAAVVVEPGTGVIVAEHELVAPGEASVLDEHYDGPRPAPNRGPRPKTTAEQQFCALGDDAEAFLVGAAAIGNTRLGSRVGGPARPGCRPRRTTLVAALRRAVAFRRFRAADVRSILAAGAGTPQPRPAGDALVLDLPVAADPIPGRLQDHPAVDGERVMTTASEDRKPVATKLGAAAGG